MIATPKATETDRTRHTTKARITLVVILVRFMGSFLSVFNWAKRYYDTVRGKIKKDILEFIVIEKSDRMLT
jgi:Sec-independent protein secretion pathway component TatC